MFKICVIGCGNITANAHGPALSKYTSLHPDTVLAGCCDLNPERAESFRTAFGCRKAYTDYASMLSEIHPDAVCLFVPPPLTCALAVDILKRGYPLLTEKPPGRSTEELLRIHEAAQHAGVTVQTAFNRRYTPIMRELKKRIGNESIRSVTYELYRSHRYDADFATTAIHAIDAARFIAGSDYAHTDIAYQFLPEYSESAANIFINGWMQNGSLIQLALVPAGGAIIERASVNTGEAAYFAEFPIGNSADVPGCIRRITPKGETDRIDGSELPDGTRLFELSGFYEEDRVFLDHIRDSGEVRNDLLSALQSVEMADCIRHRLTVYDA